MTLLLIKEVHQVGIRSYVKFEPLDGPLEFIISLISRSYFTKDSKFFEVTSVSRCVLIYDEYR